MSIKINTALVSPQGGTSILNCDGVAGRIFSKKPLKGTKMFFLWAWLQEKIPLRDTKIKHNLACS